MVKEKIFMPSKLYSIIFIDIYLESWEYNLLLYAIYYLRYSFHG